MQTRSVPEKRLLLVRGTIRDAFNKNFVFIVDQSEEWKVTQGVQTLKGGQELHHLDDEWSGGAKVA